MSSRFRRSLHFPELPPAARPPFLDLDMDHRMYGLSDIVGGCLRQRLAALGMSRRTTDDIRGALLAWCADTCDAINESSRGGVAVDLLAEAFPMRHEEMKVWLRAEWSSREALIEMCWRLHFHPTLITAVTWLYDTAEPPSESRRQAVRAVI